MQADTRLFHALTSSEALEASVLKLRDDLARLRRGVRRWAVGVTALLAFIAGLVIWQLWSQTIMKREMKSEMAKLRQGIMAYTGMEAQVRASQTEKDPAALQERVYADLAKQLGVDAKLLREKLPRFAEDLKRAPNASSYERANAAYVAKDYPEAEGFALQAVDEARKAAPSKVKNILRALTLAGLAAQKNVEYARAMEHLREAEKLTDRDRTPSEWAGVQYAIANLLLDQGQYHDAESIARTTVEARAHVLGSEDPETLRSRSQVAVALWREGKYREAESDLRELIKLEEKVIGPEHPDTLRARNSLAIALVEQGKYGEAEAENRQVIKLRERMLGPEDRETLLSRNELALTLGQEGKYADAKAEYRQILKISEKVLGPEHPDALRSRGNLALELAAKGNYAEAETEYRQVRRLTEKVLGLEHPEALRMRRNLAGVLGNEGKYVEAETEYRQVIKLHENVLGSENRNTLGTHAELAWVLDKDGKYAEAEIEIRP